MGRRAGIALRAKTRINFADGADDRRPIAVEQDLAERCLRRRSIRRTLDERLRTAKSALPPPVIWLLGKAQSGKTSLVQAMTGSSRAEIGGGFRPCTRTAQMYSFPNEEECFLRFLDTRGLGEAGQDGSAEIPKLEAAGRSDHRRGQGHGPRPAARAGHPPRRRRTPPRLADPRPANRAARRLPGRRMRHAIPYPYAEPPYPPAVPHDLARSLLAQRELVSRDFIGPVSCRSISRCRKTASSRSIMAWSNSGR